jgi:hypothetical protein
MRPRGSSALKKRKVPKILTQKKNKLSRQLSILYIFTCKNEKNTEIPE